MTDIPLKPRTQLPPGTTGAVGAPISLADQSGLKSVGQAIQQVASATAEKLTKARAANEYAAFQGGRDAEIAKFEAHVASHPNDSPEKLKKERARMMANINALSNQANTGIGRDLIQKDLLRNKEVLNAKTTAFIQAIQAKQELASSEQAIKGFVNNFDIPGLRSHAELQVEADIYNKEAMFGYEENGKHINGRFDNLVDDINKAQEKVAIDSVGKQAFAAWEASTQLTDESGELIDPDGDLAAEGGAFDIIDASGMSEEDKTKTKNTLTSRVNSRRAEMKTQTQQDIAKVDEQVASLMRDGNLTEAQVTINNAQIPSTEKIRLDNVLNDYKESINKTKDDIVTSDETNIAIDRILARLRNDKEYTYDMGLADYAELSKDVKASEGSKNLNDIRTAADAVSDPILSRPSMVRAQRSLQSILAAKVAGLKTQQKGSELQSSIRTAQAGARRMANDLDQWARDNAEAPDFDRKLEAKTNQLLEPVAADVTLTWFQNTFAPFPDRLLANKKLNVFKEDPVFATLSDEEKATAEKFFEQGGTIQEIKDKLNAK
jgi:hypothetical protein